MSDADPTRTGGTDAEPGRTDSDDAGQATAPDAEAGGTGGDGETDGTGGRRETAPAGSDGEAGRVAAGDAVLRIENLTKRFGGITAVDGASFAVERGSITGLIGPNGAGKSTTFDLVTGVHRADGGRVLFDGEDVTDLEPHQLARRGLVRTFQISREFPEMTVLENCMVAPTGQLGESLTWSVLPGLRGEVVEQEAAVAETVWETLEYFEIDHLAGEYASSLSGGQRKLLGLARALLTEPDLLLLDEPMAGVNPTLEEKLLERIHDLRDRGYTFLLVEHDMDLIMEHCEHVIVMHQGQVLAEGPPERIRSDERVIDAYLGEEV